MRPPEMWIALIPFGAVEVPTVCLDEREAVWRARSGYEVWRVYGLERVRLPEDAERHSEGRG
jgi:hypothetical protein